MCEQGCTYKISDNLQVGVEGGNVSLLRDTVVRREAVHCAIQDKAKPTNLSYIHGVSSTSLSDVSSEINT
jgi:hypothetical protein